MDKLDYYLEVSPKAMLSYIDSKSLDAMDVGGFSSSPKGERVTIEELIKWTYEDYGRDFLEVLNQTAAATQCKFTGDN